MHLVFFACLDLRADGRVRRRGFSFTLIDAAVPAIMGANLILKTRDGAARIGRSSTEIAKISFAPRFVSGLSPRHFALHVVVALLFERGLGVSRRVY